MIKFNHKFFCVNFNNNQNQNEDNEDENKKNNKKKFESFKEFIYFAGKQYQKDSKKYNLIISSFLILIAIFSDRYLINYQGSEQELMQLLQSNQECLIKIKNLKNNSLYDNQQAVIQYHKEGHYYEYISQNWKQLYTQLQKLQNNYKQLEIKLDHQSKKQKLSIFNNKIQDISFYIFMIYLLKSMFGNQSPGGLKSMMNQSEKIMQKKFTKQKSNIKFTEVAGLEESKHEIQEFVEFLNTHEKFKTLGAKIPRGALLTGPPGTGKTLLIKALAGEANVPFYAVSGSEFVELFVGVGPQRVRKLFSEAKQNSPAIIFIDEIDAIGRKRAQGLGSNTESDSTLNQLLVEMDGFQTQQKVIVFGATNRKELLDDALLRPGRFDRLIDVNLPNLDERQSIYKVHLKKINIQENSLDKHAKRLACLSPGFSGADIANVCNEAAIYAVRNKHDFVNEQDFEMAIERVVGGLERQYKGEEDERKIVAVHECGHGVVSWFLEGASPLLKLTIIPRSKGALGFAQYLPNEDSLQTEMELRHQIISILGGRISEEIFFGKITTGAYDDLQKAYRIARSLVTKLGMVSSIGLLSLEENQFGIKNYSDSTNYEIDKACEKIILEATEECRKIVIQHKEDIQNLSEVLLQKQTIDLKDITKVLGQRPFICKKNFQQYLEESLKMEKI